MVDQLRKPPHSIESEESVLSACINGYAKDVLSTGLTAEQFYKNAHQKIYAAVVSMESELVAASLPGIVNTLRDIGELESVGGASFIAHLIDLPIPPNIEHYCNIIKEKAVRRKIIAKAADIIKSCHEDPEIDSLLEKSSKLNDDDDVKAIIGHSRYKLVPLNEIKPTPPNWLIDGILEKDSLSLIFGDPECGKSLMAISMACCVATGRDFHSYKAHKHPVIYIAGEGQNGLARRFKAWEIMNSNGSGKKLLDNAPIYISMVPAQMCDPVHSTHVIAAIDQIADKVGPPGLIIIDTLARNFGPGDENSTKEMGMFVQSADALRARHKASVLLAHHTGHGEKNRARGSMALKGALDCEYKMSRDDFDNIRFEATKMKDGPKPDPMMYSISVVELMQQGDKMITSATLFLKEWADPGASFAGNTARGKNQGMIISALTELYENHKGNVDKNGVGTARVLERDLFDACKKRGMKSSNYSRTKKSMIEKLFIAVEGGYVYFGEGAQSLRDQFN